MQLSKTRRRGLMSWTWGLLFLLAELVVVGGVGAYGQEPSNENAAPMGGVWHDDYVTARETAKSAKQMLLILFCDPEKQSAYDDFLSRFVEDPDVALRLRSFTKAKLTTKSTATSGEGRAVVLLDHAAFREMLGGPGFAIVDLRDEKAKHYHEVVSVYPFGAEGRLRGPRMTRQEFTTLLSLPPGSLTQRTLIFAVRTHPEQPQSADAEVSPVLFEEAEQHAQYQAEIRRQGHHSWESRFHRINARLPDNSVAQEVCAESWPGQNLFDAAREMVHSWRQSSGHWGAVRERPRFFGYDMKLGENGVWYATGIFGR